MPPFARKALEATGGAGPEGGQGGSRGGGGVGGGGGEQSDGPLSARTREMLAGESQAGAFWDGVG